MALLACGLLTVAGVAGICGAMVANLTPRAVHGTAMALLALANNLFGLAPGPMITGWLSDRTDLLTALKLLPLPCLLALAAMWLARGDYAQAVAKK
jgi:MFS family permease